MMCFSYDVDRGVRFKTRLHTQTHAHTHMGFPVAHSGPRFLPPHIPYREETVCSFLLSPLNPRYCLVEVVQGCPRDTNIILAIIHVSVAFTLSGNAFRTKVVVGVRVGVQT